MNTLNIKTGKRNWNLTVIRFDYKRGEWVLASQSGLTYWMTRNGVCLTGRNRKQTRTYNWTITNDQDVRVALQRSPAYDELDYLADIAA